MPEKRLADTLREFLLTAQGKEIDLKYIREELKIDPASPSWNGLREQMARLTKEGLLKPSGRKDGIYKVITQIKQITVFGRERLPLRDIAFPRNYDNSEELLFAHDIVIRGGDLILVAGRSNYGKTTLCLNFCAENIDESPVLMGNEYTTIDDEPSQRFLNRLDKLGTIHWFDEVTGQDRFVLLPVREDYAEHVVKDKINIIDWINLDDEPWKISKEMEDIKRALGKNGVGIIVIQKSAGADSGRGGQYTKDFADVEILLDAFGEKEILMTIGKVKESKCRVSGRTFAYSIDDGVKIVNFREIAKCGICFGKGWRGTSPCQICSKTGFVEVKEVGCDACDACDACDEV